MSFFLKRALWVVVLLNGIGSLRAQEYNPLPGKIIGIVRDAETGEGLPYVNISVNDTLYGAVSSLDGSFEIPNLPVGRYNLNASYVGYREQLLDHIRVASGEVTRVAFELLPTTMTASEVIVTATRKPQAVKLAPASIGLVTSQQLREKNIATFDQAFDEVPGIVVTRSSGSNVQAFSIRGASEVAGGGAGNRVLLLIDGRPALSPESGGALWNLVPVNSIERIEVVKGAYSSLYGSSAMGGVVNVITHNPSPESKTKVNLNYGFYNRAPKSAEYNRYNDFYTAEMSTSRSMGRFSYLFDGGWKHNDGNREKSGFDLINFFTKMGYSLNGNRNLQLSFNANRIKNDTPATWLSPRLAYSVANYRKDDYQDRREFNTDLYYYALPNASVKYSTRFFYYHSYSKYTFDEDPGNDSTNVNIGKQSTIPTFIHTRRLGNVSQVDWHLSEKHYLIGGTDIKLDRIDGVPDSLLYGKHDAFNFGAYVQDEITFGKKLTATLGARVDYYHIIGEFQETNFSPKLAWVYQLGEDVSIRMLMAQAFRNPSIAERFIKYEQGGGIRFEPNPGLRSEKLVFSCEVGSKMKIAKNTDLDASVFFNRYHDLISFLQVSLPHEQLRYRVVNLKDAVMQGFEVSLSQTVGSFLRMNIGYTYLDARDVSSDRFNDDLAYKMKHTLSASATVHYDRFILNLNGRYRSRIKEVFIYPGSEPGAAMVLNAKLIYSLAEKHSIYFATDNFTNTQYEELERYRMPGRSYALGMTMNF